MVKPKKFRHMTQEEKFMCLLKAKISDAKLVIKYKNTVKTQEDFYRYIGQLFAYEESLKLYQRFKEGKL